MRKTICETFDAIESNLLDGDTVKARILLRKARKMAQRMESRLLDYRRAIEVLGFKRDKSIETPVVDD
jgi:hypothetical protein